MYTTFFMNMVKKIEFTKDALKQIEKIVLEKGPNKYFRISVKGGGCSGFKYNFTFDEKQSSYQDYQLIRIQELPEELPPGQLPQSSDVHLTGDMVNIARPGDRLNLTGIVRIDQPEYRGNEASSIFRSKIEGNYIDIEAKGPEDVELTKDEEELIIDFAKDPEAYPKLIKSIAPNIQGLESQKEAVLLMLIGAPNKTTDD